MIKNCPNCGCPFWRRATLKGSQHAMKACASCNGPFDLNDDASFKALERAARSGKVAALKYLNEWRRLKERINAKA